jgi:hypothetical protein
MCRGLSAPLSDTSVLLYLAFLFNHVHDLSGLVVRSIPFVYCLSAGIYPKGGEAIKEPYQLGQYDWPNPPLIGTPPLISFVVPRSIIFVCR